MPTRSIVSAASAGGVAYMDHGSRLFPTAADFKFRPGGGAVNCDAKLSETYLSDAFGAEI
jgi:hypothetical protein